MQPKNWDTYLQSHAVRRIRLGQGGADVWEVDGQYVVKQARREALSNQGFLSYRKEALFYQWAGGKSFLPQLLDLSITDSQVTLWMKKYRPLQPQMLEKPILAQIMDALAQVHTMVKTAGIPPFFKQPAPKSELLSSRQIEQCLSGWQTVLSEHPGTFDPAWLEKAAANINRIIQWRNTQKQTLCHGDFHLENLLLDRDSSIKICDWQSAAIGIPSGDISFFVSRLGAEGSAPSVQELLGYYGEAVCRLTGSPVNQEEMLRSASAANLITSFVHWHQYLAGAAVQQVGEIYGKMAEDLSAFL